jgi:mannose/cellobiose epimerase-like protein (N-acyl-D-glucosamine 2-epimerase family)
MDRLIERARHLVGALLARLRDARRVNGGHLHFFMDPTGEAFAFETGGQRVPLALDAGSPYGYSDLFGAKGMYAAANLLGEAGALGEARAFCQAVYRDILARTFRSDQPQPGFGARAWVGDALSHGPAMISLDMAALFAQYDPGPESVEMGLRLARYVLENHVNLHGWPALRDHDLVEFVDEAGRPWTDEEGRIVSDPGHSLEFVGLFMKFSRAVGRYAGATPSQADELRTIERLMPAVLRRAFGNGYQPAVGGICKTVDLLSRKPIDDTMPWWSLPETIRAALAVWRVARNTEDRAKCLEILALAHNAFVTHYVRPEVYLMAVKLRDARGDTLDLIPAYPDADPGYHTCLSLIDALDWVYPPR